MIGYSDTHKDHFINPRNVGEIADATVIGEVGSMSSGQALKLYLKLDDDENITAASFKVFGSPSAIASSSALTEMLKGKHIDEAARITSEDISKYLGGLPEEKMHACVMSMEALEVAYARLRGIDLDVDLDEDDEFNVCRCFNVPEHKIQRAIRDNNLTTVEEITHFTKAGGGCGSCHVDLANILGTIRSEAEAVEKQTQASREKVEKNDKFTGSTLELATRIQAVLDRDIRPALAMDGGDMELVDVQGNTVYIELQGHCNSCSSSAQTMQFFVEDKLREHVDPNLEVIDTTNHSVERHAPPVR
ncbi:MAG: Fe-S cluster assembly protein NifU [Planctomycetes bacterium]|nr:Fe-S cluster assembly protein NifU [Planctomycetota bacterium]